nr:hypothetical protein [Tanacetum cinerariifolium]
MANLSKDIQCAGFDTRPPMLDSTDFASWNQATIQDGKVVIQNVQGRQYRGQGNNAQGASAAGYGGAQNRVGYANTGQARQIKCYNCNGIGEWVILDEEQLLFIAGGQENIVYDDVDEQSIQDLALNVDNVFQADDCDAKLRLQLLRG